MNVRTRTKICGSKSKRFEAMTKNTGSLTLKVKVVKDRNNLVKIECFTFLIETQARDAIGSARWKQFQKVRFQEVYL